VSLIVVEEFAMATPSASAPEAQAPINYFGRIIGVFFSPKQTFASIAERPSWLAPMLLMVVLAIGVGALLNAKMNWGQYIRQKAEENPRFSQLSEEQKDQALAGQVKFWSTFSYGVGAVALPLSALIFALIYWAAFNLFRGAGLRYGQTFGIVTHAFLPTAISSILALIILPLKTYGDVDPESIVATSLKAYLPDSAPKPLAALGTSVELFWIWFLVLAAIGFAAANPKKIKPGASFGIVFGLWAVWVFAKVAWASI
jgi:Yip1 domain